MCVVLCSTFLSNNCWLCLACRKNLFVRFAWRLLSPSLSSSLHFFDFVLQQNDVDAICVPCGHMGTCFSCSKLIIPSISLFFSFFYSLRFFPQLVLCWLLFRSLSQCPFCRQSVTFMKVYQSGVEM
jgi:hypothetical protein